MLVEKVILTFLVEALVEENLEDSTVLACRNLQTVELRYMY